MIKSSLSEKTSFEQFRFFQIPKHGLRSHQGYFTLIGESIEEFHAWGWKGGFHTGMMGGPEDVETQKAPAAVLQVTQPVVAITFVSISFPEVPESYSLFQEKSDDRILHGASH